MADEKTAAVVYALLALTIMLPLLGEGYYLALDMQFGPNTFSEFQFSTLYGYDVNPYGAYLPLWLGLAALSQFLAVEIIEKLLLFSILFLCGFLMHISLPKELGYSRYFAGLLYMLNPFVFVRFLAGHWAILLSYALWPLAIALFLSFIKKPDNRTLVNVAIVTFLASISSHGLILLLICYAVMFAFHVPGQKKTAELVKRTALLALLVIAMNLFWLIPVLAMFGDKYSPATAGDYIADFAPLADGMPVALSLATMHGFWREGFVYTKDMFDFWPIAYLIIAAASFIGLSVLLEEKRETAMALAVLFLIALFLALGGDAPHARIYAAIESIIPIQFFFRDSQKFVGLMALVYSVFGAYGAHYLTLKAGNKKTVVLAALLAVPLIYNFGFFGFLGQTGPTQFPEEWIEANGIIAEDNVSGRILVLPMHMYSTYTWVNGNQKTLGNPESQFFSKPVIAGRGIETPNVPGDIRDPAGEYVEYLFDNRQYINNTAEMLLPLNARYILLDKTDENYIHYLYLFHRVGGVEDIELVYEGESLYLFRNTLVRGPFFTPEDNGSEVEYEELTPAFYKISDSGHEEIVFAREYNRFLSFGEEPVYPWNGIANGFVYAGPGMLENRMFDYTLMFLLLWLFVFVWLLTEADKAAAFFALALVIVYMLAIEGVLGPAGLGWIIIFSISGAFCFRCLNKR